MRVIIIIALLLQVFVASGQTDNKQLITVEEALNIAFRNNSCQLSGSDRKKLSCDIKSAWYLWLFQIHKWQTMQYYQYLLGDLDRIASLRYKAGDIDLLQKSTYTTQLADIQTSTSILAGEIEMTQNQLKQLLVVRNEIIPADTSLSLYQVVKNSGNEESLMHQANPSVPVDSLLYSYQTFIATMYIENKQLELNNFFIRLHYYDTVGLAHAETILQTSRTKFETEEIEYLEYTESLAKAFAIKIEYLETLNNYNQHAIHLEYYAY